MGRSYEKANCCCCYIITTYHIWPLGACNDTVLLYWNAGSSGVSIGSWYIKHNICHKCVTEKCIYQSCKLLLLHHFKIKIQCTEIFLQKSQELLVMAGVLNYYSLQQHSFLVFRYNVAEDPTACRATKMCKFNLCKQQQSRILTKFPKLEIPLLNKIHNN